MYQCPACLTTLTPEGFCDKCDGVAEFSPLTWRIMVNGQSACMGYAQNAKDARRQADAMFNIKGELVLGLNI